MKILNILPYYPDLSSGAHVRDYNIIKYLSEVGIDSKTLCNVDSEYKSNIAVLEEELNTKISATKAPDIHFLTKIKVVLFSQMYPPIYRYARPIHIETISSLIKNNYFDIIDARHIIEAAPTLAASSKTSFKGCKIISLHNVDHLNFTRSIELFKNPLIRFACTHVATKLENHEFDMISKFDHLIVVSNVDKDIYATKGIPMEKIDVIPNGVDCNYFNVPKFANDHILEHPNIIFMGLLSYQPNNISVKIYLDAVHPRIKKEIPDIKFYVIGKSCPKWLREKSKIDNSIKIIGFVNDVRPYICDADICIAPLTAGSGTRLKILEYMAMEKPVVSTTIGAEGLDVENNKNILIEDEWNKFANVIIELLNNDNFAKKIGTNGRKLVEEKYDWKNIAEKQKRIYEKLLEK